MGSKTKKNMKCLKVCTGSFILDGEYEKAEIRMAEGRMNCYLIDSTDGEIGYESASGGVKNGFSDLSYSERSGGWGDCRPSASDHGCISI